MKRRLVLGSTAALVLSMNAAWAQQKVGDAPTLAGKLVSGKPVDLAAMKDKVTVVQFWATWCPTCVKEMPDVQAFYNTNKAKLNLVSISIDDTSKELTDWLAKQKYDLPFVWNGDIKHSFGKIKGTPSFFVVGKDGKILKSYRGGIGKTEFAEITALL
jgi:cytochrome c biogenesis protein CcmG, thiol:disulfide interchange protein DsbE